MQVGERPGIGVVAAAGPAMAVGEALALLLRDAEIAGRPGLDQHHVHVGDAALGAGGAEGGIGLGDALALHELVDDDASLRPRHMVPALQLLAGEIDDTVEGPVARRLVAADEGFATRQVTWPKAADVHLVRLVQGHRLEPGGRVEPGAGPHYGDGPLNLGGAQRI